MLNQQCAVMTHYSINPHIQPLLFRVLAADKLGICYGTIQVDSISSSCGQAEGDRFKLSFPYARCNVTWNVLFDSQCPEMGPDFIFNDSNFLADVDIDDLSAKVPSLAKWNPNNRDALLNVLIELLTCYKQHQIQLLQKQNRLYCEYTKLVKSTFVKPEDVEMILLPSSTKPAEARFLIKISIDISDIQPLIHEPNINIAMLLVTFSGTEWGRILPQLHFTKPLEEVLSETGALCLPYFPSSNCLADYVLEVQKYMQEKVNTVAGGLRARREYITAALALDGMCCLEYNVSKHTYIASLFQRDDFYFVLHIQLPLGFPKEAPIVNLRSTYHMSSEFDAYNEIVENYPYNPLWMPHKMYKKLRSFIMQYTKNFKENATKM